MQGADARGKLALLLGFLVVVSLSPAALLPAWAAAVLLTARRHAITVPLRALAVLPFSALLALSVWWTTGIAGAVLLLAKAYVSAAAVVLFALTTPVPRWTAALRVWRVPSALVETIEFLYRYLALLAEEAGRMRLAMRARGGFRFAASAGALGVLFARSWQRSENVHRAMLARGYRGGSS